MFKTILLKASKPARQVPYLLLGCISAAYVAKSASKRPAHADSDTSSVAAQDRSALDVSAEQKAVLEKIKAGLAQGVRDSVLAFTAEENAAWEEEKSGCSFCQYFFESPCAEPFRHWSRCVDIAKAQNLDYISTCSVYTNALMACTELEARHFEALRSTERGLPSEAGAGAKEASAEAVGESVTA